MAHPAKRVKLEDNATNATVVRTQRSAFLDSLCRPVSPPPGSRSISTMTTAASGDLASTTQRTRTKHSAQTSRSRSATKREPKILPSPFDLSRVRDAKTADNVDTVSLHDILGDPLIREAWVFNFCFDVDWLMQFFDSDVREMVNITVVHGSWRQEDTNKIGIDDACSRWTNVKSIQAYLPDRFGTHHSKMFILFRHDDHAQVVIHTANMLAKDWTNMTQALWRSPMLPLLKKDLNSHKDEIGIGARFKHDLDRYLTAYGKKLKPLRDQIQAYDFHNVQAALVASVPTKFKVSASDDIVWGHEMLRRALQKLHTESARADSQEHCVFQVSSIASLPSKWLEDTFCRACGSSKQSTSIIFPTASDVAESLDGYAAGGSIHTKAQSSTHLQQISQMQPQLRRWTAGSVVSSQAGRHLAAPHIKTYVRFASKPTVSNPRPEIDWALVSSANLSTQAWGSAPKLNKGEKDPQNAIVHIQSYEIGVLVYPGLYAGHEEAEVSSPSVEPSSIKMVPSFKKNDPDGPVSSADLTIGFRMPYDLPLTPYAADELPWSPQSSYGTPDRHGRLWQ